MFGSLPLITVRQEQGQAAQPAPLCLTRTDELVYDDLGTIREITERHPRARVVIVGHGGALSMSLGLILDRDYSQWRGVMSNCAVSELVLDPTPRLLTFNHTGHLEGM